MRLQEVNQLMQTVADVEEAWRVVDALEDARISVADLAIDAANLSVCPENLTVQQSILEESLPPEPDLWTELRSAIEPQRLETTQLADVLDGYQQSWNGISSTSDAAGSIAPVSEALTAFAPASSLAELYRVTGLANALSTTNFTIDTAASLAEAIRPAADWKPVLSQISPPLEASFVAHLSAADWSLYSSIRPEILSATEEMSRSFDALPQNTFVDYMGTLFELDFGLNLEPELNLDILRVPEAVYRRSRPAVLKRVIVWLAGKPRIVEFTGVLIGETVGTGTGMIVGDAAGTLVGNVAGGGLGYALGKCLVVVVRHYNDRL